MPPAIFALALALGSTVALSPPEAQPQAQPQPYEAKPQPQPQPQPYPQPQVQPQPQAQPYPQPQVQPQPQPYEPQPYEAQPQAQPQPQPQPYQPQPYAPQQPYQGPPPASEPPPPPPESRGIGMLVAAPLIVGVGVPFGFLGNAAWRDNCGPTDTNSKCADGSLAAVASHTVTGLSYGVGAMLAALGGARLGKHNAKNGRGGDPTGFIVGGGVLLPASLIGMGMVRLFLWLPTPDCETYGCVHRYQTISTGAVAGFALTTSLGAAMLTYGLGHRRWTPSAPISLTPQLGRGYAGLGLRGQF